MFETLSSATSVVLMLSLLEFVPLDGARVLLVVENVNSHVSLFSRLGLELAALGNDVRLLAPSSVRVPDFVRQPRYDEVSGDFRRQNMTSVTKTTSGGGRFNYTTFAVGVDTPHSTSLEFNNLMMEFALARSTLERVVCNTKIIRSLLDHYAHDNEYLIGNRDLMNELRLGNYEFVIVDPSSTLMTVPLSLDVPYAAMSLCAHSSFYYRLPRLPSIYASYKFGFTDRLDFTQRLLNLVNELIVAMGHAMNAQYVKIVAPSGDSWISFQEAFRQASLWFIIENPSVSFASPMMPNTVPVGDLMAGRAGFPLPPDLDRFLSTSTDGVVVVSFGSYLDNLHEDVIAKFCDAFRRLRPGRRVVWKQKTSDPCSDVERVKTVPWIPQNDLLADQRVRLFISHGGLNGMMEAVFHAKPIIVFPVFFDQPANAAAAASKGYAVRMDLGGFTSDSLLENMEKILSDESYELSARHWSAILRDRQHTPAERVSHMIDHVIKYGDSHLRTGAYELSLLQFWMFDLFAVICSLALISSIICCAVVMCAAFKCFGRIRSNAAECRARKSD